MEKRDNRWNAVITIIISITGLIVSMQATRISNLQATIAKNSALPNIQIEERKQFDDITGKEDEFVIEISNLEGRINNYNSQTITFLTCDYIDSDGNYYEVEVPVFSYFFLNVVSGNNIGLLEKKMTVGNGSKIIQLQMDAIEYGNESGECLNISIDTYLKISYVDLLGEEQVYYYVIDLLKPQILDKTLGEGKFCKYNTYQSLSDEVYGIDPNKKQSICVDELIEIIRNISILEDEDYKSQNKEGEKEMIIEMLSRVSPDGWIGFLGNIIGASITTISIVTAIIIARKQMKQQEKQLKKPYHDALLESLPSFDSIITQADYLDDEDGLLGTFTTAEGKLNILEERYKSSTITDKEKSILEYKIKRQKEYLEYWKNANDKIDDFIKSGSFNAVKSNCSGTVIGCYYEFVVSFDNEHNYCGPVIDSQLIREKMLSLVDAIHTDK